MKLPIRLSLLVLFAVSYCGYSQSLEPGLHNTYALDNFSGTPTEGLHWWSESDVYSLSRQANGLLTINCNYASLDYSSFGIDFLNNQQNDIQPIDIIDHPTLKVIFQNPSNVNLEIRTWLVDENNVAINADANQSQMYYTLAPGEHEMVLDFTNAYSFEWSNCIECPEISQNYDLSKIKRVVFIVNGGGTGADNSFTPYTGNLFIKRFQLGDARCLDPADEIVGNGILCANSEEVEYRIDPVVNALNYVWTVPEDATIVEGGGTNHIKVNFGQESGIISVIPENECGQGRTSTKNVIVENPVGSGGEIQVDDIVCSNTTTSISLNGVAFATGYLWELPVGFEILSGDNSHSLEVKVGSTGSEISVTPFNNCGSGSKITSELEVHPSPAKPSITQQGDILESTIAPIYNYRWYRYSEILSGENSYMLDIAVAGHYTVEVGNENGTCWTASDPFPVAISSGGIGATYVVDDFQLEENHPNIIWNFNTLNKSFSRVNGAQYITCDGPQENFPNFYVYFGINENEESKTIDVADYPIVKLVVENTSSNAKRLIVNIGDVFGRTINSIENGGTDFFVAPGVHEISIDFSNGVDAFVCPECPPCDLTKITHVWFGFDLNSNECPEYMVFKHFELGERQCIGIPGEINGSVNLCKNASEIEYSIGEVEDATFYLWTVPQGATISQGQGTNNVTVNFGNASGEVSVTPSNSCQSGRTVSLAIEVDEAVGAAEVIIGEDQPCSYSEIEFSIESVEFARSYTWSVTGDGEIIEENEKEILLSIGTDPLILKVQAHNSCGAGLETSKIINPIYAPAKPEIEKDSLTLTSSLSSTYRWYKNNILLEEANGQILQAPGSGSYVVEINGEGGDCWTSSDPVFVALSQVNGRTSTFVRDDFAYPEPYINTEGGGVYWWSGNESVYTLNRIGSGIMSIQATNADPYWSSFGISWGTDESIQPYTVDLRQNAMLRFVVENPSDKELVLSAQIFDIDNKFAQVGADTSEGKEIAEVIIPANGTNELFIDLTNGYTTEWICHQQHDCPRLTDDFNWEKVAGVVFQVNAGAGMGFDREPFTGTIYLRDFEVGNFVTQDGFQLRSIPAQDYQWYKDDQILFGAKSQTYTAEGSGSYKVKITDIDGSEYMSHAHRVDVISSLTSERPMDIIVYPNPTSDMILVQYVGQVLSVKVKDIYGSELLTSKLKETHIGSLPDGIYLIEIGTDKGIVTKKVIKQ